MEQYYFLFGIGLLWSIFAVVQDLKTREVSNWLNFSLIGFALAYRAFYSLFSSDYLFLISGLLGFGVFFGLAHLFYYTKVFAGGDAKLLMGFGVILPYGNFNELLFLGVTFCFALFFFGALYGLIYSVFIVLKNMKRFKREFFRRIKIVKWVFFVLLLFSIILMFLDYSIIIFGIFVILLLFLYAYVKALDSCMIKLVNFKNLQEGDWLEKDVKIGKKMIKKSVHGLSKDEIKLLKKFRKSVYIKEGIPFTPAFLLSLIAMVFFSLTSGFDFLLSLF